jgi:hypothetical protein
MNWYGSGLVVLLIYGVTGNAPNVNNSLITESTNLDILTELSQNILTET